MLRFLGRQQRARNIFLIFIAFVMVVGLVILYMPMGQALFRRARTRADIDSSTVVAEVEGETITVGEYRKALSRLTQSRFGRGFEDLSFMKTFGGEILDRLIEERLLLVEAKKLKISATSDEVFKTLLPMFRDASGRFVGRERYFRAIEQSGQTVEEFEEGLRRSIIQDKIRSYLTAPIEVTPREIEEDYVRNNTSLKLDYVIIKAKDFQDRVKVDENEARSYFEQHRDEFLIKEIERQVDYIHIPLDRLSVTITQKELQEEYDRTKSEHTTGAFVSQIELPFTSDNETEVRKKADDLVKRARGDDKTPAEDFKKLGGKNIGFVRKDTKDTSYKQRVFNLADTQKNVTEPIREEKDSKFYILKVTEWKRKSLGKVKADLTRRIRERKQRDEASKLADEIKKRLDEAKNLRQVAAEFSKKLKMPVEQLVRRTGFFAVGDELSEFGSYSSSFISQAASLNEIGEIGSSIYLSDGYAIPQLVAKREPHAPQFEEVKERVTRKLRLNKASELASERARKLIADSPTVEALKRSAKAAKLDVKTQEEFKFGTTLPDLDRSEELEGYAFSLEVNHVCPKPVKVGDVLVVFGVAERKNPDLTKLAAERDSIRERLLSTKRENFYSAYLDNLRKKMEAEGRIVIHQDVIDALLAPGSEPEPPQRRQTRPGRR